MTTCAHGHKIFPNFTSYGGSSSFVGYRALQRIHRWCHLIWIKEGCISMSFYIGYVSLFVIRYDLSSLKVLSAPELGCSISVSAHAKNRSCCVYWKPSVACTVSKVKLIASCATEGFPQCCSTVCLYM